MSSSIIKKATLVYDEVIEITNDKCICFESRDKDYILMSLGNNKLKEVKRYKELISIGEDVLALKDIAGEISLIRKGKDEIIEDGYVYVTYNNSLLVALKDNLGKTDIVNISKWKVVQNIWSDMVTIYDRYNFYKITSKGTGFDRLFNEHGEVIVNDRNKIEILKNGYILAIYTGGESLRFIEIESNKVLVDYRDKSKCIVNKNNSIDIVAIVNNENKHWKELKQCKIIE